MVSPLNIFFPSVAADVVGIFDQNFQQQFPNARPMRAFVRETARPMEHPTESGQTITDYRIIMPTEITMPMMITAAFYRDTYNLIGIAFQNSDLLNVQTKTRIYRKMIIADMPHEESPEFYDTITINLRFKQVIVVAPTSNFAPADPTQADTQARGEQNTFTAAGHTQAVQQQINAAFLSGGL